MALLRNLKFNFEHIQNFNKVAVVTDLIWIQNAAEVKDVMVGADIEIFSNENRLSALNWISE